MLRGTLLVVSHKHHDVTTGGKYIVSGGFTKLKRQFACHAESVRLCVPVAATSQDLDGLTYPSNVTVTPLPSRGAAWRRIAGLPKVLSILWREVGRADLVYAMCPTDMGLLALVLAKIRKRPVFISVDTDRAGISRLHAGTGLLGVVRSQLVRLYVNGTLKRFGGTCPAYFTGDLFLGPKPHWRQWIKTTVTSKELPEFVQSSQEALSSVRVVFVGRLQPEKNVPCLIEAVRILQQKGVTVSLTIIGSGPERSRLEGECAQLEAGSFTFVDHIANSELLKSRFFGADVLVLPSLEERQGKVLLEAMACSIPVVAARAGGIPSVITNEENGLLFDPRSPEELCKCISLIAECPRTRAALVENGYAFAKEAALDITVAKIMSEVIGFYGLPVRGLE